MTWPMDWAAFTVLLAGCLASGAGLALLAAAVRPD